MVLAASDVVYTFFMEEKVQASVLIGQSQPMQQVLRVLKKIVGTDSPVLILGESGTGKELVAKYIHQNGPRSLNPMLSVNCSAFNDSLLESELFGYRKGAFTGAEDHKIGLFDQANGGTLFLDEVAEMSSDMQKKLLRVIEDGEIRPLGGKVTVRTDVRILAATNKNLRRLVQLNKFREDLYFRFNVLTVRLPALRERREDIPLLLDYYTDRICKQLQRPRVVIPAGIRRLFFEYDWPGNVRELINELRRVIILESQYQFDAVENQEQQEPFPGPDPADTQPQNNVPLVLTEKDSIVKALEKTEGNKSKAAGLLGIARRTLYVKLKKYGIRD